MKTIIISTIVALMVMTSISAQAKKSKVDMDQFTVKVDGLGCPFCAYGLEKKFKELKGIDDMNIDLETGLLTFTFPTEEKLSIESIEEQVKKAGYTPVFVEIQRFNGEFESTQKTNASVVGETTTTNIMVAGNCGMCEARIEQAAKSLPGVTEANWDADEQLLTVSFDTELITLEDIESVIAQSGHDTENLIAQDEVYNTLPGCCKYDRLSK